MTATVLWFDWLRQPKRLQHVKNDSDTFSNALLFIWILNQYAFQHSTFNIQHSTVGIIRITNAKNNLFSIIVGALLMICYCHRKFIQSPFKVRYSWGSWLVTFGLLSFEVHITLTCVFSFLEGGEGSQAPRCRWLPVAGCQLPVSCILFIIWKFHCSEQTLRDLLFHFFL